MSELKMHHRQSVPIGFTIKVQLSGSITMCAAELAPYRQAILDFIKADRAIHQEHFQKAKNYLKIPNGEDAPEASRMIMIAERNLEDLALIESALTSETNGAQFTTGEMLISRMFEAINAHTGKAA